MLRARRGAAGWGGEEREEEALSGRGEDGGWR